MVQEQLQQQGTKVWAKMKGYPWWPGQIAEEAAMPKAAIPSRRLPSAVPILFYGSNDFAWLHAADIKPFDEGNAPDTPKKQAGKLLEAIRLAKEDGAPTGRLPSFTEQDSSVDEESAEGSEEEEEDYAEAKRKKRRASVSKKSVGKATPKARRTPQTRKISKTPVPASSGTNTPKRKAPPVTGSSKRKKVQRDEDAEMRDAGIDAVQMIQPKKSTKDLKKNCPPYEHLMYLRHRIQKMMKEDPHSFGACEKIEASMQEIENFTMTIDLLKETKVGKLMKKVMLMDFDPDPNNVKQRAGLLIRKWKTEFHMDKESEQTQGGDDAGGDAASSLESDNKPPSAEKSEDELSPSKECDDKPFSSKKCEDKPSLAKECEDKPSSAMECEDKPSSAKECEDKPSSAMECEDKPSSAMECEYKPSSANGCKDKPSSLKECEGKPFSTVECEDKPSSAMECDEKPFSTKQREDKPFSAEECEDKPFSVKECADDDRANCDAENSGCPADNSVNCKDTADGDKETSTAEPKRNSVQETETGAAAEKDGATSLTHSHEVSSPS